MNATQLLHHRADTGKLVEPGPEARTIPERLEHPVVSRDQVRLGERDEPVELYFVHLGDDGHPLDQVPLGREGPTDRQVDRGGVKLEAQVGELRVDVGVLQQVEGSTLFGHQGAHRLSHPLSPGDRVRREGDEPLYPAQPGGVKVQQRPCHQFEGLCHAGFVYRLRHLRQETAHFARLSVRYGPPGIPHGVEEGVARRGTVSWLPRLASLLENPLNEYPLRPEGSRAVQPAPEYLERITLDLQPPAGSPGLELIERWDRALGRDGLAAR